MSNDYDFTQLPGYDPESDIYTAPSTPTPTPRPRPALDLGGLGGFIGTAAAAERPAEDVSPWAATQPARKATTPAPRRLVPEDEDSPWAASQPPPEHADTVRKAYAAGHDAAMTRLEAASLGLQDMVGLGWRDEIAAAAKTSDLPEWMGGYRGIYRLLTGMSPQQRQAYEQELARQQELSRQAFEQRPGYYRAGELGGFGVGAVALPSIPAGRLISGAPGWLQRAATAATTGGAFGGVQGAGTAQEGDRLPGAAEGAALGGLVGGVASPTLDAAGLAARVAAEHGRQWYQGLRAMFDQPFIDEEAARRIATARAIDTEMRGGAEALTPAEQNIAARAQLPITNIEQGAGMRGEQTLALARSAANVSPEARTVLGDLARERFRTQGNRAGNFISSLFGNAPEASTEILALEQAARRANAPAYRAAYAAGDWPMRSPTLDRLMSSPSVKDAMRTAVRTSQDRAVVEGLGAFNPGVTVTNDGRIIFAKGPGGVPTYPNLQYWDSVHRDLADMIEKNQGRSPNKVFDLTNLHRQLLDELDSLVPRYQTARAGHAANMGARSALELGRSMVMSKADNADFARTLAPMSDPERELVARGFGSELIKQISQIPDNRDVINQAFWNNDAARRRIAMALNGAGIAPGGGRDIGATRAQQIEAYLRLESIADRLRGALGNSTTARQLIESGMASPAGHSTLSGLLGLAGVEHLGQGHLASIGAALAAAYISHHATAAQVSIARRIGEMLVSGNPVQASRAARIAAANPQFMATLRTIHSQLPGLIARAPSAFGEPSEPRARLPAAAPRPPG